MKTFALLFTVILFAACSKSGDDVKPAPSPTAVQMKAVYGVSKDTVEVTGLIGAGGVGVLPTFHIDSLTHDSSVSFTAHIGDTIHFGFYSNNIGNKPTHGYTSLQVLQDNKEAYNHLWIPGGSNSFGVTLVVK